MKTKSITLNCSNDESTKTPQSPKPFDIESPKPGNGDGTIGTGEDNEDGDIRPYK